MKRDLLVAVHCYANKIDQILLRIQVKHEAKNDCKLCQKREFYRYFVLCAKYKIQMLM